MSEDTQPNERRLNRKGNSAVPVIRTTRPRGSYRGYRGSGRGTLHHPYSYSGVNANGWQAWNNQDSSNALSYAQAGPSSHTPHAPYHSNSYGTWQTQDNQYASTAAYFPPQYNYRNSYTAPYQSSPASSSYTPHDPYFPPVPAPQNAPHVATQDTPEHPPAEDTPPKTSYHFRTRRVKKGTSITTLVVDLPEECRKGAHNSKQNRMEWLKKQISHLESELGVCVRDYQPVGADGARFEYYYPDQATAQASQAPAPLPRAPPSAPSYRSTQSVMSEIQKPKPKTQADIVKLEVPPAEAQAAPACNPSPVPPPCLPVSKVSTLEYRVLFLIYS